MTSPEQQQSNESPTKPDDDQGKGKSSPTVFRPVLGELRARQANEEARLQAKKLKQARHKAQSEFKAWKRSLCRLIEKESKLLFDEAALTWQFVVPARLNRFFYEVMIKEYVRAKKAANEGDAAALVRQEFDAVADAAIAAEKQLLEQKKEEGEAIP